MKALISIVLLLLTAVPAGAKTPFVFAFEAQEIFPFYMGNSSQVREENPGVSVEVITRLEQYLPIEVSFVRLSWKRALIALKAGRVDGIIASYKPGRKESGIYPSVNGLPDPERALSQSSYYLYTREGADISWDPENLSFTGVEREIGAPSGYSIIALLKKTGVGVDEYGNTRENLVKVLAGRIDGAALLEFDADRILFHEKEKFAGVIRLEPALVSKNYYLVLSHQFHEKYPGLSKRIWDACVAIRDNDRGPILRRYLQMKQ